MNSVKLRELSENRYLIIGSNNIIVSKEEKLKIERDDSILKDFYSNICQKDEVKKRKKIDKELEKIADEKTKETASNPIKKTK